MRTSLLPKRLSNNLLIKIPILLFLLRLVKVEMSNAMLLFLMGVRCNVVNAFLWSLAISGDAVYRPTPVREDTVFGGLLACT